MGLDFTARAGSAALAAALQRVMTERLAPAEFHPDIWDAAIILDPAATEQALTRVAGDRYSYRELDQFTDVIKRTLQTVPQVSKVFRAGILPEQIFLDYSQEALTTAGVPLSRLAEILNARNITLPGGMLDVQGKSLLIDPSGEFRSEADIGNVIVSTSPSGTPVYLRDVVDVVRGYQTPRYLNYYYARDRAAAVAAGRGASRWRSRCVPASRSASSARRWTPRLPGWRHGCPPTSSSRRPSDQPLQVRENVDLFMRSLYEAIALVVLVALIGFWEWRSALVMALAIPLTLAMTFGLMDLLGIDIQQVSVASLIIALGLLVDDPVVAGDAIKRELDHGQPQHHRGVARADQAGDGDPVRHHHEHRRLSAAAHAAGARPARFIYSLPVVLACSLDRLADRVDDVHSAARLLPAAPGRRRAPPSAQERRARGFTGMYYTRGRLGDRSPVDRAGRRARAARLAGGAA